MSTYKSSSSTAAKLISISAILAIFAFCGYWAFVSAFDSSSATKRIVITGSSTIAPLIEEVAKRYEKEHPEYRIDVQTGGSSRGISDVQNGLADIGMASRELKPNEQTGLATHCVAVDGIGIIVHRDNPVSQLTSDQIKDIYLGKVQNWSELGGTNEPIAVINKASGRGTLEVFVKHFQLNEADIKADIIVGENQQAILTVNSNTAAIGYVSIGAADAEIKHGANLKLITLDRVAASTESVANGTFPVSRKLNLVTSSDSSTAVNNFIEYATSNQVNDLVESQFFVPVSN